LVRDAGADRADVAVEFEWLGHPLVFVGVRRGQGGARDVADFEDRVARIAEQGAAGPAEALAALAAGPPAVAAHIELGAANAWRSVGPLRLWAAGADPAGPVEELLLRRPDLARCAFPVALVLTYDQPRVCWAGIEVSEPSATENVLTPARVAAVLRRLVPQGS